MSRILVTGAGGVVGGYVAEAFADHELVLTGLTGARPRCSTSPTRLLFVNSAFFPLPAPRARSEVMINYKLDLLGINPMRPWRTPSRRT